MALAQYRELASFAQFASDLDDVTRRQLERGHRATEIMKQPQYSPMSVAEMALVMFAIDKGYLDDVPVNKVVKAEADILAFVGAHHRAFLDKINATGDYNAEIEKEIAAILTDAKKNLSWD